MYCKRAAGLAACLLLFGFLSSCQKKIAGQPPRYTVVRFENLTGDPALEWTGRAAAEVLSRSLSGRLDGPMLNPAALSRVSASPGFHAAAAPGISSQHSEALAARATRIITGYVERTGGQIRIAASEEDVATGKTVRRVSASRATPLAAMRALAHAFSPNARPYLTSNQDALRLYTTGIEEDTRVSGATLEQALQADPNFGPAWVALAGTGMARGDREAAESAVAEARRHSLDSISEADLDLAAAALTNNQNARIAALRKISAMSPGDTGLLRSIAETETSLGQFAASAGDWSKLASVLPGDVGVWNQLGYTRAWSGDYAGALAALKEYARIVPNDPNPLDSMGDVEYMYRKFPEAARSYLAADAKDPRFLQGGGLYKASWAKFEAGDKAGADTAFAQFRAVREKAGDRNLPLFEADWLYRTARRQEAVALLRKTVASPDTFAQLAVWELLDGDRAAAARDAAAAGRPTSPALLAVRFAAMPSASAAEWESRAAKMMPGPAMAGPRTLALGYALLLDGKRQDALPCFEKVVAASGNDFFLRALCARLKGERPTLEIPPDATRINEFAAILNRI